MWRRGGSLGPLYSPSQLPKVLVVFDGTGTPAFVTNYNGSSITDNGAGDWTLNYIPTLANANTAVVAMCREDASSTRPYVSVEFGTTPGVNSVRLQANNSSSEASTDMNRVCVAVFGAP